LGEDIGKALGCGGHLTTLRRTQTGVFDLSQSITLDRLQELEESERLHELKPVACLLAGHTPVTLGAADAARFLSGLRRRGDWPDSDRVAVFGPSPQAGDVQPVLLGAAHVRAGELIPDRLLSPIEIEQTLSLQRASALN
jgi:tRNA pseudouridine55 synthase